MFLPAECWHAVLLDACCQQGRWQLLERLRLLGLVTSDWQQMTVSFQRSEHFWKRVCEDVLHCPEASAFRGLYSSWKETAIHCWNILVDWWITNKKARELWALTWSDLRQVPEIGISRVYSKCDIVKQLGGVIRERQQQRQQKSRRRLARLDKRHAALLKLGWTDAQITKVRTKYGVDLLSAACLKKLLAALETARVRRQQLVLILIAEGLLPALEHPSCRHHIHRYLHDRTLGGLNQGLLNALRFCLRVYGIV